MAPDRDRAPIDLTPTAMSLLRPIMRDLVRDLGGELSDAASIRVGEALGVAFEAGLRVGGAEAIGDITDVLREHGIDLDAYLDVVGPDGGA